MHPDSIDLNKPFLEQWLSKVYAAGSLKEGFSQELPELEKSTTLARVTSNPTTEHIKNLATTPHRFKESASLPLSSVPQLQTANEVSHNTVSVDDNDDLYRDPDNETTVPDDSFAVRERNAPPNSQGVSRFRSSSTA